jgi:hypothetical protein
LTVAVSAILLLFLNLGNENFALEITGKVLIVVLTLVALLRFGILALTVMTFVHTMLLTIPITLNPSYWYAPNSYFMLIILVGMTAYGLRTTLGGRSFFPVAVDKRFAEASG